MGRPPSPMRYVNEAGTEAGIALRKEDVSVAHLLHRWHAMRAETLTLALGKEPTDAAVSALTRRLRRWRQVVPEPLMARTTVGWDWQGLWSLTGQGHKAFDTMWPWRGEPQPLRMAHAALAADVGVTLEALGVRVYSEREHSTRWAKDGERLPEYRAKFWNPAGKETAVAPDLVIPLGEGASAPWIAVEIERRTSRDLRDYRTKLRAYWQEPRAAAVWYFSSAKSIGDRVDAAAEEIGLPEAYPLRVVDVNESAGLAGIRGLLGPLVAADGALAGDMGGRALPPL